MDSTTMEKRAIPFKGNSLINAKEIIRQHKNH
jgi:hypothetical protein